MISSIKILFNIYWVDLGVKMGFIGRVIEWEMNTV